MEILQNLTDNQLAVIGCLGALLCSGGLMALSVHFNPDAQERVADQPVAGATGEQRNAKTSRKAA